MLFVWIVHIHSRICPPSSRVSPVCYPQNPSGGDTLGSRTLSDVASLCHSLRWCKKITAHPQLRTLVWCSALPFSSPLLLAFRLQSSECSYKNAPNRQSVKQIKSRGRPLLFFVVLADAYLQQPMPLPQQFMMRSQGRISQILQPQQHTKSRMRI